MLLLPLFDLGSRLVHMHMYRQVTGFSNLLNTLQGWPTNRIGRMRGQSTVQ